MIRCDLGTDVPYDFIRGTDVPSDHLDNSVVKHFTIVEFYKRYKQAILIYIMVVR